MRDMGAKLMGAAFIIGWMGIDTRLKSKHMGLMWRRTYGMRLMEVIRSQDV